MALPKGIIEDFEKVTNYSLTEYLRDYVAFINNQRIKILDYYAGRSDAPNLIAFETLKSLLTQARILEGVIEGNSDRFRSGAYWELIDTLSEISTSLDTMENSSRWLRSSITKGNFSPQIEIERILRQFQTLESMASQTGSNDPDKDWINIALRNDLPEEGYTPDGGNVLQVVGSNRFSFQLRSVVDNISGRNVYGIDLHKKIQFADDDLLALSYDDTIRQTVDVLAKLIKGDTPEFREDGLQASLVTGTNKHQIAYPIITRQFYNTFEKDDTLKSLKITKLGVEQDTLVINFEIETRLSEILQATQKI